MALFANQEDSRLLVKPAADFSAHVRVKFGRTVECGQRVFASHELPYTLLSKLYKATDDLEMEEIVTQLEQAVFVADGIRPDARIDDRMSFVRDILHNSLGRSTTLVELADLACISKAQLVRSFRAVYGQSVYGYLKSLRLEGARYWLASSELPISTVALRNGFTSESSFSREFRKKFGLTPSSDRKLSRSEQF